MSDEDIIKQLKAEISLLEYQVEAITEDRDLYKSAFTRLKAEFGMCLSHLNSVYEKFSDIENYKDEDPLEDYEVVEGDPQPYTLNDNQEKIKKNDPATKVVALMQDREKLHEQLTQARSLADEMRQAAEGAETELQAARGQIARMTVNLARERRKNEKQCSDQAKIIYGDLQDMLPKIREHVEREGGPLGPCLCNACLMLPEMDRMAAELEQRERRIEDLERQVWEAHRAWMCVGMCWDGADGSPSLRREACPICLRYYHRVYGDRG